MKFTRNHRLFLDNNPQWASFVGPYSKDDAADRLNDMVIPADYKLISKMSLKELNEKIKHGCRGLRSIGAMLSSPIFRQQIYKGAVCGAEVEATDKRAFNSTLAHVGEPSYSIQLFFTTYNDEIFNGIRSGKYLRSNWFDLKVQDSHEKTFALRTVFLPRSIACNPELWRGLCTMIRKFGYASSDTTSLMTINVPFESMHDGLTRTSKIHPLLSVGDLRKRALDQFILLYETTSRFGRTDDSDLYSFVGNRGSSWDTRGGDLTMRGSAAQVIFNTMLEDNHINKKQRRKVFKIINNKVFTATSQGYSELQTVYDHCGCRAVNQRNYYHNPFIPCFKIQRNHSTLDPQLLHAQIVFYDTLCEVFRETFRFADVTFANVYSLVRTIMQRILSQRKNSQLTHIVQAFAKNTLRTIKEYDRLYEGPVFPCPLPWVAADINPDSGRTT